MALSFETSMRKHKQGNNISVQPLSYPAMAVADINLLSDEFQKSDKYEWYDDYSDDEVCVIDSQKNISVNSNQINITQESNSQYIPFKMPRYYDGMDLMKMNILIHYCTSQGFENYSNPINVSYSDSEIKFGWLIDKNATAHEGTLQFEIHATGVNSHEDEYKWMTKINNQLNILRSLHGNGVAEPDQSWTDSFFAQINEKVGEAQKYAKQAETSASTAAEDTKEKITAEIGETLVNSIGTITGGTSENI